MSRLPAQREATLRWHMQKSGSQHRIGRKQQGEVSGRSFFLLVLTGLLGAIGALAGDSAAPRYILFLTADGFRTDYVEWYQPPTIKQLISEGVRVVHATNVFPSVTSPNMASLVTGSYPRTTGIGCNAQYEKEHDRISSHIRNNGAITIAETLHRAGWKTAAVNHFMLQKSVQTYMDAGYDESEKTSDAILELLKDSEIRFIGVIYGATDHAGHRYGPRSEEVRKAVLGIDSALARVIQALKDRGVYEQTLITFNSDHGMSAFEDKQASIEPAKALEKAGFKVAKSEEELKDDTQIVVLSYGVRLVYFRKPLSEADSARVRAVLSGIEGVEILERARLDALGCHNNHSGDLIISPLPGYTISNAGKTGGQHGRFTEQNPILVFRGPGFKRGATVDAANTVDAVPTLLRLTGIEPAGTVEGRIIAAALQDQR